MQWLWDLRAQQHWTYVSVAMLMKFSKILQLKWSNNFTSKPAGFKSGTSKFFTSKIKMTRVRQHKVRLFGVYYP